jgi:D-alanyl-D-alanine carboxypeptidase
MPDIRPIRTSQICLGVIAPDLAASFAASRFDLVGNGTPSFRVVLVPKSRPLVRNPLFVFVPPIVLLALGLTFISQPGAFAPQHELVIQAIDGRKAADKPAATLALASYHQTRLATEQGGSDFVVVNKQRPLKPIDYQPVNLREIKSSKSLDNSRGLQLSNQAATALEELAEDMKAAGAGKLFVNSAFRSFDYQQELFKSKTRQYGVAGALVRSAKAGHSEHQTGLAIDVSVPEQGCAIMQCFGDTTGGKWLAQNSWKHGFIIRYEKDTTSTTGYTYEPWHLRYVGVQLATLYSKTGMKTLEDFWGFSAAEFYLEETASSTSN